MHTPQFSLFLQFSGPVVENLDYTTTTSSSGCNFTEEIDRDHVRVVSMTLCASCAHHVEDAAIQCEKVELGLQDLAIAAQSAAC